LSGYSEEEIIGRNCRFLQGPASDQAVIAQMHEAIHSALNFRGEVLNYRKDGSVFWNSLTISPVKDAEGKVAYFVGIQKDITVQKEALLKQDKLIQELKAINTGLTRFALTTSHELKNPLSAIIGFANVLRENYQSTLDHDGQQLLERIAANANYLNQCLDDLRQFGVLGHVPLRGETISLSRIVSDVVQILGISPEEPFVHYSESLPSIKCNRQLMIQVFRNLIDNASKYGMARERGVRIEARLLPNSECEIRVSDYGRGVPENIRASIFDPFVSTSHSVGSGTGLGLAIVKKIVELHNGKIECHSSSAGTTFVIRLPIVD
jgi:two-component system sensor histidine kinase/response regulator